jgi:hypothetical protein
VSFLMGLPNNRLRQIHTNLPFLAWQKMRWDKLIGIDEHGKNIYQAVWIKSVLSTSKQTPKHIVHLKTWTWSVHSRTPVHCITWRVIMNWRLWWNVPSCVGVSGGMIQTTMHW